MTEGQIPDLTPAEWHRRIVGLLELIKDDGRPWVQSREALLDGRRVLVVGLVHGRPDASRHRGAAGEPDLDEVFRPVAVVLDDYIARSIKVGDHGPWFPRRRPDEIWQ